MHLNKSGRGMEAYKEKREWVKKRLRYILDTEPNIPISTLSKRFNMASTCIRKIIKAVS